MPDHPVQNRLTGISVLLAMLRKQAEGDERIEQDFRWRPFVSIFAASCAEVAPFPMAFPMAVKTSSFSADKMQRLGI